MALKKCLKHDQHGLSTSALPGDHLDLGSLQVCICRVVSIQTHVYLLDPFGDCRESANQRIFVRFRAIFMFHNKYLYTVRQYIFASIFTNIDYQTWFDSLKCFTQRLNHILQRSAASSPKHQSKECPDGHLLLF